MNVEKREGGEKEKKSAKRADEDRSEKSEKGKLGKKTLMLEGIVAVAASALIAAGCGGAPNTKGEMDSETDADVEDVNEDTVEDAVEDSAEDVLDTVDEDVTEDPTEDAVEDPVEEDVEEEDVVEEDVIGDPVEEDVEEEEVVEAVCTPIDQIRTVWISNGGVAPIGGIETKYTGLNLSGEVTYDILCGGVPVRTDVTVPIGGSETVIVSEHGFDVTLTVYSADSTRAQTNINVDAY